MLLPYGSCTCELHVNRHRWTSVMPVMQQPTGVHKHRKTRPKHTCTVYVSFRSNTWHERHSCKSTVTGCLGHHGGSEWYEAFNHQNRPSHYCCPRDTCQFLFLSPPFPYSRWGQLTATSWRGPKVFLLMAGSLSGHSRMDRISVIHFHVP